MKIAFITPEAYPFVKTGGLADVSFSLPRALARRGHEVLLVLPRYYRVDKQKFFLKLIPKPLGVPLGSGEKWAGIYRSEYLSDVEAIFIEHDNFFGRDGLYDDGYHAYGDNGERFAFFCRAVLQALPAIGFRPEIIHCNDWQSALVPVYLRTHYAHEPFYRTTSSVMTVHNVGYQGVFPVEMMECAAIGREHFHPGALEFYGQMNFLKGGIVFADAVTTVSRRYAREIQSAEFGYDLAGVFASLGSRLYGITNGVDYEKWDPQNDPRIPANYSSKKISGKKTCKRYLQNRFGLEESNTVPVIGTISRLTYQKGIDVLAESLFILMKEKLCQFVIVGSGDSHIMWRFEELKRTFPGRVGIYWGYDEDLAHLVESGSDIYVMPSRYEPCGLNQMYSLRYGAVPVVRATGGLDDTVVDWFTDHERGNGFKFFELSPGVLSETLQRVFEVYHHDEEWKKIVRRGMEVYYSWDQAAEEYELIYQKLSAGYTEYK